MKNRAIWPFPHVATFLYVHLGAPWENQQNQIVPNGDLCTSSCRAWAPISENQLKLHKSRLYIGVLTVQSRPSWLRPGPLLWICELCRLQSFLATPMVVVSRSHMMLLAKENIKKGFIDPYWIRICTVCRTYELPSLRLTPTSQACGLTLLTCVLLFMMHSSLWPSVCWSMCMLWH